jgi:hypothetical protein
MVKILNFKKDAKIIKLNAAVMSLNVTVGQARTRKI